ncbi:hypothetical protein P261_00355 [Lachnospiraceae bacterium TWA4]|nr:hypothetical protein P261_00355 [Lachnospiraceae bacterium TWA4]
MSNRYDTEGMKSGASQIESELRNFDSARKEIDRIIETMGANYFRDQLSGQFIRLYRNEAKPAAEDLYKTISNFASLLRECSKRYSDTIDNGNSFLLW